MIITNNDSVLIKYKDSYDTIFVEGNFRDVLILIRDKVHDGHELKTHPLSSSIKPNETPYKSVVISDQKGNLNYESVKIIENCIETYDKFSKNNLFINYTPQITEDFKLIDLTVLESALNR